MVMVFGPTILAMDGHEHLAHRGLVASAFRLKALEDWKTKLIEPITQQLIDAFVERGEADLVREFNFRFPIQVIANMLGVPSEDSGLFLRRSIEMISIAVNVERGLAASAALKRLPRADRRGAAAEPAGRSDQHARHGGDRRRPAARREHLRLPAAAACRPAPRRPTGCSATCCSGC